MPGICRVHFAYPACVYALMHYPDTWRQFCRASHVTPTNQYHWPDWHQGRERFCFWGLAIDEPDVVRHWQSLQNRLSPLLLPDYQREPHITLFAPGFWVAEAKAADEVDEAMLAEQAEWIKAAITKPFTISTAGVGSFPAAPFIEIVDNDGGLAAIRAALLKKLPDDRTVSYVPHLTLGLYHYRERTERVAEALQALPASVLDITVTGVVLYSYATHDIRSLLVREKTVIF